GLLGVAAAGTWVFYRRSQQLRPMPHLPPWIPGAARLCRTYNHGLLLNFARLLCESGLGGEDALARAAPLSGQRPDEKAPLGALDADDDSVAQLAIAERLGTVGTELRAQCEEHVGRLSMALLSTRERVSLVLKIALFLYVGTLTVAMYLPIFKSSSVI
ncbi:MAG: hypothetical protein AAFX85_06320, partial [Pseudomonadota bacterium]